MKADRVRQVLNAAVLASVFTAILLVALPASISVKSDRIGPSPYRKELDELYEIISRGLPPDSPEWEKLEVFRLKNEQWFEGEINTQSDGSIVEYFKAKSLKLSPLLAAIWGLSFVLLCKRVKNKA